MKNTILLALLLYIGIPLHAQWTVFKTGPYHFVDLKWVDSLTAYGTEGSMVFYKTIDHGKTWKEIDVEPGIAYGSLSFPTPAVGYAFTGFTGKPDSTKNGIFRTVDSGKTWHKIYPYILYGQRAHFFNAQTGFFINYGYEPEQLWYTNDSGKNWIQTNGWHGFDDWAITPSNRVYTSGYYEYEDQHGDFHYVSRLDNSGDMGYFWDDWHKAIEDSNVFWGFMSWPSNKVGYSLRGGDRYSFNTLYKTIDSGLTWKRVDATFDNCIFGIYFLDSLFGYKFGCGGMIKRTDDGGKTWTSENSGTLNLVGGMYKAPDNNLYIFGDSGLILYKSVNKTEGLDNLVSNSLTVSIFPNPCTTFLTLSWSAETENEKFIILIYDLLGKKVSELQKVTSSQGILRNEVVNFNLPAGIYLLELRSEKGYKSIVKIAVQ